MKLSVIFIDDSKMLSTPLDGNIEKFPHYGNLGKSAPKPLGVTIRNADVTKVSAVLLKVSIHGLHGENIVDRPLTQLGDHVYLAGTPNPKGGFVFHEDDDDRAYGAFVDSENGMTDWLFVPENHVPGQMTVFDVLPIEARYRLGNPDRPFKSA